MTHCKKCNSILTYREESRSNYYKSCKGVCNGCILDGANEVREEMEAENE